MVADGFCDAAPYGFASKGSSFKAVTIAATLFPRDDRAVTSIRKPIRPGIAHEIVIRVEFCRNSVKNYLRIVAKPPLEQHLKIVENFSANA